MKKYNKILSDIAKLIEVGVVSTKDFKKEIDSFINFRVQSIINKFNLPSKEELEVLNYRLEKIEKKVFNKNKKKRKKKK